eukprot:scaffold358981_cov48-Prasinocladus_malaysianus.AAC.2
MDHDSKMKAMPSLFNSSYVIISFLSGENCHISAFPCRSNILLYQQQASVLDSSKVPEYIHFQCCGLKIVKKIAVDSLSQAPG